MKGIIHLLIVSGILCCTRLNAQDINLLFKEAANLEYRFKEQDALNKYKQILVIDPNNIKALVKATELSCSTGERLPIKNDKRITFESALAYAQRAVQAHNNSADAYYALALASGKMTEVETENKKIVEFVKEIKVNADKALSINSNHGMANFIEGKWHYEMVTLNWAKKLATRTLYGRLPKPDIDSAIIYMEKCKSFEPYFVLNYLTLAKAYKENNNPAKAIEVLTKLVKLPVRTEDDAALKAEGQKILDDLE